MKNGHYKQLMKIINSLILLTVFIMLPACSSCNKTFTEVNYTPEEGGYWPVSTPEEQDLDSGKIAELYSNAAHLKTAYSLLVVKNGYLVAEHYFNGGFRNRTYRLQSVTKSFTSALAGIAIRQGCIKSVSDKMMDYFPEYRDNITDKRKFDITVEQLLQMRAGYPWEESSEKLFKVLYGGFRSSYVYQVPLNKNPGSGMEYSNLSSHLLGLVVARATGMKLLDYANENLFGPLDITPGKWIEDWEGNNNGHADMYMKARDLAKFGQLYLNGGEWDGRRILDKEWVETSLAVHSTHAWQYKVGKNVSKMCYGYQWWSAEAGDYRYPFAWGHGGQQIALVPDQNIVIVYTCDPLVGEHGSGSWSKEKANLNLVGNFVRSITE